MHNIIVIGASSGGIEALKELTAGLPSRLEASVFIVLHTLPTTPSILPQILAKGSQLPVRLAQDGEPIRNGRIYIAPPDYHLLLERDHLHLTSGPREHFSRPSINPLFRSAAHTHRENVIGVILTGQLDDGVAGLWEIKRHGGIAVVQDPTEALYPSMPLNAIDNVEIDFTVAIADMPALLSRLVVEDGKMQEGLIEKEQDGRPVDVTCPDCRGGLRQYQFGQITEFRCRVGHAHSLLSMTETHRETQERALWAAIVALEEGAILSKQLADATGSHAYVTEAEDKTRHAATLKDFITSTKYSRQP
jgi:two-component system, chemotaxis family, protein-glutamate methylesterase/glutaminase